MTQLEAQCKLRRIKGAIPLSRAVQYDIEPFARNRISILARDLDTQNMRVRDEEAPGRSTEDFIKCLLNPRAILSETSCSLLCGAPSRYCVGFIASRNKHSKLIRSQETQYSRP